MRGTRHAASRTAGLAITVVVAVVSLPHALPRRGHARLTIYDAGGRLIRQLLDDVVPSGPNTLTWDGRDQAGRRVGAGAYFFRLRAAGGNRSGKLVLLR